MDIKGKVFLVTGGASGLGEACVRRLTGLGAKVGFFDLNQKKGESLTAEVSNTHFFCTDITQEEPVLSSLKQLETKWGELSGLVNCAGVAVAEKVISKEGKVHSLDSFKKVIHVNLVGSFNMVRSFVSCVIKDPSARIQTERGIIINTASVAAFEGQLGQCAYSASKGGIVAMTLPLARELAQYGIRVVTIAPGIFETPMLQGLDEKVKLALGQMVPFPPRLGKPDEYAALVQHLCENQMINGETIRLDGAIRLAPK